jgi:hypothetical protein
VISLDFELVVYITYHIISQLVCVLSSSQLSGAAQEFDKPWESKLASFITCRCKAFLADRRSSNPALQFGQFQTTRNADRWNDDGWGRDRSGMTMSGTIGKTALLLLIAACSAGYMWQNFAVSTITLFRKDHPALV